LSLVAHEKGDRTVYIKKGKVLVGQVSDWVGEMAQRFVGRKDHLCRKKPDLGKKKGVKNKN